MLNEKLQQLHDEIKPAFNESILESLPINESHDYKQFKIFPIELLVKAEWNYKVEDENSSKKLRENLKRVGQTETIHVRLLHTGYFEVVNGNHRYDEMIALGRKTVIAYDHGQITKEEAFRRCLETNEKWFDSDNVQLGRMMKQLSESASIDDLITTMPFSEEEINNFKKLAEMESDEITPTILDNISLPSGDKSEFEQITFTLHKDQMAEVQTALQMCKAANKEEFIGEENNNKNGNALYFIIKQYLASNNAE